MKVFSLPYDTTVQIGYGPFHLGDDHPFMRAAVVHDRRYDALIDGTSLMTLKQVDREFLRNCMRAAGTIAFFQDVAEGVRYTRRAWLFYLTVRAWAKTVRRELENWRPI